MILHFANRLRVVVWHILHILRLAAAADGQLLSLCFSPTSTQPLTTLRNDFAAVHTQTGYTNSHDEDCTDPEKVRSNCCSFLRYTSYIIY